MEVVDLDKERDLKNFLSKKCCQFIYGRALNNYLGFKKYLKPTIKETREDFDIVREAYNRLNKQLIESNIPIPRKIEEKVENLDNLIKMCEAEQQTRLGYVVIEFLEIYRELRNLLGVKTNFEVDNNKFKIGQKVWYFCGHMVIQCIIEGLDFCGLYYEIDEPIGNSVMDSEIVATKEEAISKTLKHIETIDKEWEEDSGFEEEIKAGKTEDNDYLSDEEYKSREGDNSLQDYRKETIRRIKANYFEVSKEEFDSWEKDQQEYHTKMEKDWKDWGLISYREKKRYEEWFTINDVREGKVK